MDVLSTANVLFVPSQGIMEERYKTNWGNGTRVFNTLIIVVIVVFLTVILLHNITEASLGTSPHIFWLLFTLIYMEITGADGARQHRYDHGREISGGRA